MTYIYIGSKINNRLVSKVAITHLLRRRFLGGKQIMAVVSNNELIGRI